MLSHWTHIDRFEAHNESPGNPQRSRGDPKEPSKTPPSSAFMFGKHGLWFGKQTITKIFAKHSQRICAKSQRIPWRSRGDPKEPSETPSSNAFMLGKQTITKIVAKKSQRICAKSQRIPLRSRKIPWRSKEKAIAFKKSLIGRSLLKSSTNAKDP